MNNMGFNEVEQGLISLWSATRGDKRIRVAVLDGPVDLSHPCFAGRDIVQVESLVPCEAGDNAASEHGTHVASVIFGRHGGPVQGIAPGCSGLIIPVYSPKYGNTMACSQLDLARAINLAVIHGAHIINISGGELAPGGAAEPLLAGAIRRCWDSGVLIVAAAGNDGCECLHVPAAEPSVLAVGAMNSTGAPLEFSNWGQKYLVQGILAPGENIPGAVPGGGVALKTGTSYATPLVSGIAALLMSEQLARGERPDARKIRAAILESTEPCDPRAEADCKRLIAGRLNITAARARLAAGKISNSGGNLYTPAAPMLPGAVQASGVPAAETGDFQASLSNGLDIGICRNNQPKEKEIYMSNKEHDGSEEIILTGTAASEDTFITENDVAAIENTGVIPQSFSPPEEIAPVERPPGIQASDCSCKGGGDSSCKGGCNGTGPQPVYVLGQLGYDFGTEARRDQFVQLANINPYDPKQLLAYLKKDPSAAASLIWTLSLDSTVVYAIRPGGPFAATAHERLREALEDQLNKDADRVSVPGMISGSVRLLNGQVVPVIYPDARGLYSWTTFTLIKIVLGPVPKEKSGAEAYARESDGIRNFLDRIYYEVRNLGLLPQERAMNYAATNAFQVDVVFKDAIGRGLKLDQIDVEPSPICRPGSDCWDVKLIFFNPDNRFEQARHVYRFTVDVSDTIPVSVGQMRDWDIY